MLIHINYDFIGWNEYINAERANRFKASKIKRDEKELVMYTVKERYTGSYPVTLIIRPHYQHKRRDLDNFRMKGLIDGLVGAGVIENDNLTKIDKIILEPIFDNETGVDIQIEPTKRISVNLERRKTKEYLERREHGKEILLDKTKD